MFYHYNVFTVFYLSFSNLSVSICLMPWFNCRTLEHVKCEVIEKTSQVASDGRYQQVLVLKCCMCSGKMNGRGSEPLLP